MPIVWINAIDGQPPRSKHMTGLDQDRVDWLHEQVARMVEWDKPMGCPRVLPLYTAIVLVLFGLRHNMSPDVLGELFGCGSTTVERYQDELEVLIDEVLSPLYEEIQRQARRGAVLVDGLVAPLGERDGTEDLFSDKKGFCGINIQFVATLNGRLADVGDPCPGGPARQPGVPGIWDRRTLGRSLCRGRSRDDRGQRVPRDRDLQPVQEAPEAGADRAPQGL